MSKSSRIDRIDEKILAVLAENGRLPVVQIAARVGLSKSPCQARLKRLEREGVILGYRAVIDPRVQDRDHVAFAEVKLTDTTEPALQAFNAAVRRIPEIEECHMIAGPFDYLIKVRSKDVNAYRRFLGEQVSRLPHVASTATHVAMEVVKEAGASGGGA